MIAYESRASVILYHLLCSREDRRPVLIPVNVCPVVPFTCRKAGRAFSFVDIDQTDLGLDQNQCLERIRDSEGRLGGLLYVRPYGAQEDVDGFFRAAKQYDPTLIVIDDKCLCPPDLSGDRLSAVADVSLFSTGRAKYVDAGAGGFAHLADGVPYHREASLLRDKASSPPAANDERAGPSPRQHPLGQNPAEPEAVETLDLDLSLPTLSWEAYERQVSALTRVVADHKRRLNAIYSAVIPKQVRLEERFQSWRFNILVPEPDRLIERLFAEGLFASRHYAPVGRTDPEGARFPHAERLHQSIVNLFNDRYFDESRAERTATLVREHVLALRVQSDIVETL